MVTVKRNPRIMKNFQEFQESTRFKRETGTLVKGGTKYLSLIHI